MDQFQLIILLMSAAIFLVGIAKKFEIPYPIALVIGGIAIGFVPGLNSVTFDPNLILVIVLPPLLHYGAFWLSWSEFKEHAGDIFSLALGLVIVTSFCIAVLLKWLFPEFSWPLCFAFGAIVSPPDAVAATSILKRFSIGPHLLTILEGESLVNDAFALVLYKISIGALFVGTFSWAEGGIEFLKVSVGGLVFGLAMGYCIQSFSNRFLPAIVGAMFSFANPYITYILADAIGVSGVLAVVVNGFMVSQIVVKHKASIRRIIAVTSWDIFIILLNCFVFILIGLQMSAIMDKMTYAQIALYFGYACIITLAILLIRFAWVYFRQGALYLKNTLQSRASEQIFSKGTIISWCGMRGIVSLTAALALPLTLTDGHALNGRDIVIFITAGVIFLTLVIPGLTLPFLLKWLNLQYSEDLDIANDVREKLLQVAAESIELLKELNEEERSFLKTYFKTRHRVLEISSSTEFAELEKARRSILQEQRKLLLHLWEIKKIDDTLLKLLEFELDVEESLSRRAEV